MKIDEALVTIVFGRPLTKPQPDMTIVTLIQRLTALPVETKIESKRRNYVREIVDSKNDGYTSLSTLLAYAYKPSAYELTPSVLTAVHDVSDVVNLVSQFDGVSRDENGRWHMVLTTESLFLSKFTITVEPTGNDYTVTSKYIDGTVETNTATAKAVQRDIEDLVDTLFIATDDRNVIYSNEDKLTRMRNRLVRNLQWRSAH